MGLENLKNSKPVNAWTVLREMAERNGRLEKPSKTSLEQMRRIEKQVQALRSHLKDLFRLLDDPISYSREEKSYQTRFKLSFPRSDLH